MKKFHLLTILALIVTCTAGQSATIFGSIYDLSLSRVTSVILEINSTPVQRIVAVNGSYSIDLPAGSYKVLFFYPDSAEKMALEELVTVGDSGNYHIDLILYPDFSSDDQLSDNLNMTLEGADDTSPGVPLIPLLVAMVISFACLGGYWLMNKRRLPKKDAEVGDKGKLLLLLRKHDGRLTQKELREHFPYSEAKMSLLIAELEADNKIKKIKRGRGNVLVLRSGQH